MRSIHVVCGFYLAVAALAAQPRAITVDAGRVTGTIRSFNGVNGGPAPLVPQLADATRQYREIGIDLVRTHDNFGPTDIDAKWPDPDPISRRVHANGDDSIFPDWNADPESEASYHFGPSDRRIRAIIDSGAQVYYRLGRSWSADPAPPPDFDKFARVCRHVAMHYNGGWAKGFHYHIVYWEIWNEPDVKKEWAPFVRPFWTGTPEQFYSLYEKVARALKQYDPALKVGGPAMARGGTPGPYREGLIRYCAAHGVPLDFYSWHYYAERTRDPMDFVKIGRRVRELLDEAGFRTAEQCVSEWNQRGSMGGMQPTGQTSMSNVAFTAATLVYLQDSSIDRALYYRADSGDRGAVDATGALRKKAYAFQAASMMLATPRRIAVSGGDDLGMAILAGAAEDGKMVRVLIVNYPTPPRQPGVGPYRLQIENLPWRGATRVERRRVTEADAFAAVPAEWTDSLTGDVPAPGLELITLTPR